MTVLAWSVRSQLRLALIDDYEKRIVLLNEEWARDSHMSPSSTVAFSMLRTSTKIELLTGLVAELRKAEEEDVDD